MSKLSEPRLYLSPQGKLVRFFEKSRNGWKQKCQSAKRKAKALSNHVAALKKSRNHWKTLARQQREEVEQLRQELEQVKSGLWQRSSRRRQCLRSSPPPCRDIITLPG
jgi:predicted  nucleic acid-binding Zn-ribbon protein